MHSYTYLITPEPFLLCVGWLKSYLFKGSKGSLLFEPVVVSLTLLIHVTIVFLEVANYFAPTGGRFFYS